MYGAIWSRRWRSAPLRRRVDVLEVRALLVLCAVVAGCAVAIGLMSGWEAYGHERAVASQERAGRHLVRAQVLRDAAESRSWADEAGRPADVLVPARWTSVTGTGVKGSVPVAPGTRKGEYARVWLDREGRVTSAPATSREVWAGALLRGAGSASLAVGAGVVAAAGIRAAGNRYRAVQWETEWSRVEPEWSHRA
ncbi:MULTISPECIES: hypothetical protein [Streptomycetaceae]|uniref:Rv1733c family protein n=1 Tax=unclassified Streptomyces TaxID=2593676 RepID=UPI00336F0E41